MEAAILLAGALVVGCLAPLSLLFQGETRGWYVRVAGAIGLVSFVGVGLGYLPLTFWTCLIFACLTGLLVRRGLFGLPVDLRPRLFWLVVMMGVVAGLSGQAGAAGPFHEFLSIQLHLTPAQVDQVVYFARKSVHVCAYGSLALVALRFLGAAGLSRWHLILGALGWAVVTASGDELRQSITPGRTGLFSDVLLDTAAATVFIFVWTMQKRLRHAAN